MSTWGEEVTFVKSCLCKWTRILGPAVNMLCLHLETKQIFASRCKASFWPSSSWNLLFYTFNVQKLFLHRRLAEWRRRTSKDTCDRKLTAQCLKYLIWPSHQWQRARWGNIAKLELHQRMHFSKSNVRNFRELCLNVPCKHYRHKAN